MEDWDWKCLKGKYKGEYADGAEIYKASGEL